MLQLTGLGDATSFAINTCVLDGGDPDVCAAYYASNSTTGASTVAPPLCSQAPVGQPCTPDDQAASSGASPTMQITAQTPPAAQTPDCGWFANYDAATGHCVNWAGDNVDAPNTLVPAQAGSKPGAAAALPGGVSWKLLLALAVIGVGGGLAVHHYMKTHP